MRAHIYARACVRVREFLILYSYILIFLYNDKIEHEFLALVLLWSCSGRARLSRYRSIAHLISSALVVSALLARSSRRPQVSSSMRMCRIGIGSPACVVSRRRLRVRNSVMIVSPDHPAPAAASDEARVCSF